MSERIRIIIIIGMVLAIIYVMMMVHKKLINFKYGIWWSMVAFVILLLAAFPPILGTLSSLLGITLPINMLFFFGILLLCVLIFSLSKAVSDLLDKVKRLSQEVAIMRKDMYDLTKVSGDEKQAKDLK